MYTFNTFARGANKEEMASLQWQTHIIILFPIPTAFMYNRLPIIARGPNLKQISKKQTKEMHLNETERFASVHFLIYELVKQMNVNDSSFLLRWCRINILKCSPLE